MEIISDLFNGFAALFGTQTIPWWQPIPVIMIGIIITGIWH